MTDIQPIPGIPALGVGDTLVIGDLHIGVEAHLHSKGIHLTSRTKEMEKMVDRCGDSFGRIVLLGDIKDSVPGSNKQEYREIPVFCDHLLERFREVCVVRGNHDTMIEEFLPAAVRIRPATGMKIGDTGLVHGHTWPSADVMGCETLVLGHEHPHVLFKDKVGSYIPEPCWLRGRFRDAMEGDRYDRLPSSFIVMPAFNPLLGGSPVNEKGTPMLGPVLSSDLVDLDGASVYLLDGICLGRRADLMVSDTRPRMHGRRRIAVRPHPQIYSRPIVVLTGKHMSFKIPTIHVFSKQALGGLHKREGKWLDGPDWKCPGAMSIWMLPRSNIWVDSVKTNFGT